MTNNLFLNFSIILKLQKLANIISLNQIGKFDVKTISIHKSYANLHNCPEVLLIVSKLYLKVVDISSRLSTKVVCRSLHIRLTTFVDKRNDMQY